MQRETIIQLAAEMFVGQGIKAVRMDDIARHIGVSKRTIYEQFGDKEELLYQCLSYYVREQDRGTPSWVHRRRTCSKRCCWSSAT